MSKDRNVESHLPESEDSARNLPRRGRAQSFEDLRIFQEARNIVKSIYALTNTGPVVKDYALRDQLRRSALSIMSNIAEGFERGTDADFIRFLFMAKGSCGELRAQAIAGLDQKYWPPEQFNKLADSCRKISGGISRLIAYLRQSGDHRRG